MTARFLDVFLIGESSGANFWMEDSFLTIFKMEVTGEASVLVSFLSNFRPNTNVRLAGKVSKFETWGFTRAVATRANNSMINCNVSTYDAASSVSSSTGLVSDFFAAVGTTSLLDFGLEKNALR